MKKEITILIADRNPHVREFLKREMTAEGYQVRVAENGREVVNWVYRSEPLDLLILDPDLPDVDQASVLKKLQNRIPALPVVVHTFLADYANHSSLLNAAAVVEKGGSSIERLKQIVGDILRKSTLQHSPAPKRREPNSMGF